MRGEVAVKGSSRLLDRTITLLTICIKRIRVWRVELVGVTQSTKPDQKDIFLSFIDREKSDLIQGMVTIRNLKLDECHAWDINQIGLNHHLKDNTISVFHVNNDEFTSERRVGDRTPKSSKNLNLVCNPYCGTTLKSMLCMDRRVSLREKNMNFKVSLETVNQMKFYTTLEKSKKDENLIRVTREVPNIISISDVKNLIIAYESIKSKKGNMTKGSDDYTLDGISIDWIKNISLELKTGKFKFKPGRMVLIPKPGKDEKRMLIIAGPREKLVQKAIEIVFNKYFDPIMNDASHGFRPKRGVQTTINKIEQDFQSSKFIIEGDLRKAFDSIPHDKMLKKLGKHISCIKTLKLVEGMIKAGYYNGKTLVKSKVGVPQGSVLSPLLCNIYLDELDSVLDGIKEMFDVKRRGLRNPEYNKLVNRAKYLRNNLDKMGDSGKIELRSVMKELLRTNSKSFENKKITYIRYADDFIIGIEGPKSLAYDLREIIKFHLEKMGLTLNIEKTKITDWTEEPITFLGFKIKSMEDNEKAHEVIYDKNLNRKISRRKKVRLSFEFDYHKVLKKLSDSNIIRLRVRQKSNDKDDLIHRGRFRGNLIHLDHPDIINYYNTIIRGIYNYYCICRNHNQLFNILWLIRESCALTLARKFKLRTMKKVFSLFGKNLAYKKKVLFKGKEYWREYKLFSPEDTKRVRIKSWVPRYNEDQLDEIMERNWNNKFTKSNLWENCAICDADSQIEMHHVRSIRDLRDPKGKNKDWFTRAMNGINRKQIPLCNEHHKKLHKDELDVFELTNFRNYIAKSKSRHIKEFTKNSKNKWILQDKNNTIDSSKANRIRLMESRKTTEKV